MSALEFRPATPDLVREYYGGPAPWTMRAHVALKDGRVVGIGGVHFGSVVPVAFSEAKEPLSKEETVRCARFMKRFLTGFAMPVFAECTGSRRLLELLGFRATGEEGAAGPLMVRG
jgi:hypothetical protein